MRDPQRIPLVLKELEEIWKENPDLRLGQLILNCFAHDFYYMEDVELISVIKKAYQDKI
jgi:hypothetical protein